MAHPQSLESDNESAAYALVEDASTQTTDRNTRDASTQTLVEELISPGKTLNASTQTLVEELISPGKTLDASTQTPEDDLSVLGQPPAALETSEESRKRRISKVQEIGHGSDVCKLPRTETCIMSAGFDSSLKVLVVHSGNTKNINTQENVASNKNISLKENAPREKSDTNVSKVTNVSSVDDMLAVPGPSRCLEDKSYSKASIEKLQKEPSAETEQKQPTCLGCKQTISKHVEHRLEDMYKCCRCPFTYTTFNYLQMHVYYTHSKPYYCSVCQINYSEVPSHASGGTCAACDKCFKCRYQLEDHYISEHGDFLKTKCKLCKRNLDEHLTAEDAVGYKYQCCVTECKITCKSISSIDQHLGSHSPLKLNKCDICKCHFKQLEVHQQNAHPSCKSCKKSFVNIYFLNEHHCEELRKE